LSFYVAFAIIALGTSGCSMTALVTTVANWFKRKIGLASGIATCGFGLSGIMVPVIVKLIDAYGWRSAMSLLALGALVLILPLSLMFRHKPEQYGYLPDGDPPGTVQLKLEAEKAEKEKTAVEEPSYSIKQAAKSRAFWHLALAYACYHVITAAVVTHVMPYLGSIGIERSLAGMVAMGIPLSSVAGRLGMGWIADRIERRKVTIAGFIMMGLGLICFEGVSKMGSWLIIPFLLLFCIGYGGNNTMRVALVREMFGRKSYGSIFGLLMGVSTAGSFLGPPLAGWAYDTWGSYQNVWFVIACFALVSLILTLTIPRRMMTRAGA
jgi:sugar phosphate permease